MQEASRWKGEKKSSEEKKKKKKKEKKSKKDSKKKRKDKKLKAQQKELELRDALRKELGLHSKEKKKSKRASDDDEYLLRKAGISKRYVIFHSLVSPFYYLKTAAFDSINSKFSL